MLPLNKINNVLRTKSQRKDDLLSLTEFSQELRGRISFGESSDTQTYSNLPLTEQTCDN